MKIKMAKLHSCFLKLNDKNDKRKCCQNELSFFHENGDVGAPEYIGVQEAEIRVLGGDMGPKNCKRFLDASSHLYKRVCRSVRRYVTLL